MVGSNGSRVTMRTCPGSNVNGLPEHALDIEPITVTYVLPDGKRMEDYRVPAGDPDE